MVLGLLAGSLTWAATGAPAPGPIPQILADVEKQYAAAATLTAEFEQINESPLLKKKSTNKGRLFAKRPSRIRWETITPSPNLLVSDGIRFWFYTPPFDETENGQLIERRSAETQSKLVNALLSGSFSVAKDMKYKQEQASVFLMTPAPGSAGTVKQARVRIDPARKLITQVTLIHDRGNKTEVNLSRIELGKKLGEELFHFIPPPKTERVQSADYAPDVTQ